MNAHSNDDPQPETSPTRTRFVTLCQQLLVLAVVATVLTPAARTISLDVRPGGPDQQGPVGEAPLQQTGGTSPVPTERVKAKVKEVALTDRSGVRARAAQGSAAARGTRGERVQSQPVRADGYAAVGLTWDSGDFVEDDDITFRIRTRKAGTWSAWSEMPYHDEHAPDPDSPEGGKVRPGTEPIVVGDVDDIQVQADAGGGAPQDLKVAVIDPGKEEKTVVEAPSIDTSQTSATSDETEEGAELTAAGPTTPKPQIFSRRQWGANEEMRDRGSLSYHQVHAGFVHHTVNANNYRADQVDDIIRSIYAYHTRSRGWSDIGYNFLIDKFGRIWEGRAGGVDRPVVGAHTRGYNAHSFAAAAIGNYETAHPWKKQIDAFGRLFAWKLALHGVNAVAPRVNVAGRTFQAINGHRDAGSTACPGRNLYKRLGEIRTLARSYQANWHGRTLDSDLAGGPSPDLVMMRASDGRGMVLTLTKGNGKYRTGEFIDTGLNLKSARNILKVGDWDGDGHGDLVIRRYASDKLILHRGNGRGQFDKGTVIKSHFRWHTKLAGVGDFNGDGFVDIIAKPGGQNAMKLFPGKGSAGMGWGQRIYGPINGAPIAVGLWDRGGAPDVIWRENNRLHAYMGNGPGGFYARRKLGANLSKYDAFVGVGNYGLGPHEDFVARERGTRRLILIPGSYKYNGSFSGPAVYLGQLAGYHKVR